MILRRFMEHASQQNWFAVGLDLIVVVLGIFLGMQVTDWNAERLNRELETEYLERLQVDVASNINQFEETIAVYQIFVSDLMKSIEIIEGDVPFDAEAKKFVSQAIPMNAAWRHVIVELGTIRELIASGEMNIVQNQALRQRLIGISSNFEAMNEQMSYYKDWYLNQEAELYAGMYMRFSVEVDEYSNTGGSTVDDLNDTKDRITGRFYEQEFLVPSKTRALGLMLGARNTMLGTFLKNLEYLRVTSDLINQELAAR